MLVFCCTQCGCLYPSHIHTLPTLLPLRPTIYSCRYKMGFAVKANAQHKAESTDGGRTSCDTEFTQWCHTVSGTPGKLPLRAQREGHQQVTGGANPHNIRTYLHPLPVDFHEEDTERVGFGGDIPVQKVLATDGQLDLADTVLGADGRCRRGRHGVRHGDSSSRHSGGQDRDKPQGWQAANTPPALHRQQATGSLSYTRDPSHEAFLAPSPRRPEWKPSRAPMTCCEFAP